MKKQKKISISDDVLQQKVYDSINESLNLTLDDVKKSLFLIKDYISSSVKQGYVLEIRNFGVFRYNEKEEKVKFKANKNMNSLFI